MNTRCLLFLALFVALVIAQPRAIAVLQRSNAASPVNLQGTITFAPDGTTGNTTVTVYITGLNPSSQYGMHVHEFGDLKDTTAGQSVGSHWNPFNVSHGCPEYTSNRHLGDMGNWDTDASGVINQVKSIDLIALTGNYSILGRAVTLHNMTDDCVVLGSAGARLGFGVVGIANMTGNTADNTDANITQLVAYLSATPLSPNATAKGVVFFEKDGPCGGSTTTINIMGEFDGITLGTPGHGLHVHNYGDLTNVNGTTFGTHWSIANEIHNLPISSNNNNKHQGDFGNVKHSYNNLAYISRCDNNYITDFNQLIGRGIILHASFDHGSGAGCDQAGNSGSRILVGVIGISNTANFISDSSSVRNAITVSSYDYKADASMTCLPPSSSSQAGDASRFIVSSVIVFFCALVVALLL